MVNWNPITMYNDMHLDPEIISGEERRNQTLDSETDDQRLNRIEQRSGSLDESIPQAEVQREFTGVLPSDFDGYLLHPDTIQNSQLQHGTEDMPVYYQQKVPPSKQEANKQRIPPPDYIHTPPSRNEDGLLFFGDSNTTELRANSRTTLDQDSLRRGSVTTLPSASSHSRRNSSVQASPVFNTHEKEPMLTQSQPHAERSRKSSLTDIAYLAAAGVVGAASSVASGVTGAASSVAGTASGVAGAASSLFTSNRNNKFDMRGPHYVVRDEYGPYKDATTCGYEPAIHGQSPCFKSREDKGRVVTPNATHPFCSHVQEPVVYGERPVDTSESGIPQSQLHEPTKRADLDNCNVDEGQIASTGITSSVDRQNPLMFVQNQDVPQSQLDESTEHKDIGDTDVHEDNVSSTRQKPGLLNKATLAASGLASAAAATLFGSKTRSDTHTENTQHTGTEMAKDEPAIHGQSPCLYTQDDVRDECSPDRSHPFCGNVSEPVIHGQSPHLHAKDDVGDEHSFDTAHSFNDHANKPELLDERPGHFESSQASNASRQGHSFGNSAIAPTAAASATSAAALLSSKAQSNTHTRSEQHTDTTGVTRAEPAIHGESHDRFIKNQASNVSSQGYSSGNSTSASTATADTISDTMPCYFKKKELRDTAEINNAHPVSSQVQEPGTYKEGYNYSSEDRISQPQAQKYSKHTDMYDTNSHEQQDSATSEEPGLLDKATIAASGLASAAAATLFGSKAQSNTHSEKDNVRDAPGRSHPLRDHVNEPKLHDERPDRLETNQAYNGSRQGYSTGSATVAPTAVAATTTAAQRSDHGTNSATHIASVGAPTNARNNTVLNSSSDASRTAAPNASAPTNSKRNSLGVPISTVAATAAATSAATRSTGTGHSDATARPIPPAKNNRNLAEVERTTAPITSTRSSTDAGNPATLTSSDDTNITNDSKTTAPVHSAGTRTADFAAPNAALASAAATTQNNESLNMKSDRPKSKGIFIRPNPNPNSTIASDRSISSAAAIKYGNFGPAVDSTDHYIGDGPYQRNGSLQNIKSKAAALRHRLSRDSSSGGIDKSTIIKQNDAHRLSDAEQFKQDVSPQQRYVRNAAVTPGPSDAGESQFIRQDSSSQSEIPSRGTYVSGHIEHRRGSIQKIVGTIINNKEMKEKGEHAKLSGKEKIEAYKSSKEVHPNDAVPIRATNLTHF